MFLLHDAIHKHGLCCRPVSVKTDLCQAPSIGNVCPALYTETWTLLAADTKTLEAIHLRCQRQILDIRWWAHVQRR